MTSTWQTEAFGKWILAGEHAVLRGSPALVFPVFGKSLKLSFTEISKPLTVEFKGSHGGELHLLFWGVVEKALELVGHNRNELTGQFTVENSVPVGAGLGASATLCVSVGRWLQSRGWIKEEALYEFSRQLENLFHGESSGVDIAVALSGRGLHFERAGDRYSLEPMWKPKWYISYSGARGVTSECVAKVKALWERDRTEGEAIDQQMREAVALAERSLRMEYSPQVLGQLARSINLARECFDRWGLTGGECGKHIQTLQESGAVAVKPTGSGGGGYVLSLWENEPPQEIVSQLISLSR